jgi:hypothetical protein
MGIESEAASKLTGSTGSSNSKKTNDAKTGIKVDTEAIKATGAAVRNLTDDFKKLADQIERAAKASSTISGVGGTQAGGTKAPNGMPLGQNTSKTSPAQNGVNGQGTGFVSSGGGGGGRFGGGGGKLGGAVGAMGVASVFGAGANMFGGWGARMDRGAEYASGVDKVNMVSQQIYGLSQKQALQQREPLRDSKLGFGGINALTTYQQTSGTSAMGMAPEVAGLRALSGFSLGTQDIIGLQKSFTDPGTVNRQQMFGMSTYTGDSVKGPYAQIQGFANRLGINNRDDIPGALRQGSRTRERLAMMGAPEGSADLILAQAQAQITFREKGGKGTYDANNKDHQKKIGVDENLAMAQEETDRIRVAREEEYTKNHIDHLKTAEDINRGMLLALMKIEGYLAPATGAVAAGRGLIGAASNAALTVGSIMMVASGGTLTPVAGGLIAAGTIGKAVSGGDPPDSGGNHNHSGVAPVGVTNSSGNDANIKIPVGGGGGRKTLNEIKERSDFKTMHPKMQQRLLSMFRENPNLGIGGGTRKSSDQETMFRDRYRKTGNSDGDVYWEGAWWDRVSGPPAAPPGRSMHEIGLAADLVGDLDWLQANASRFGLKTFAAVNNEPWHVQPQELANSRAEYEKNGSAWGTDGSYEEDVVFTDKSGKYSPGGVKGSGGDVSGHGGSASSLGAIEGLNGMSVEEIIDLVSQQSTALLGSGAGFGGGKAPVGNTSPSGTAVDAFSGTPQQGAMAAAEAAYAVGFRGEDLATIVAISGRESRWRSIKSDKSDDWGFWQINGIHMDWLKKAGIANEKSDLLNLATNARAAFGLYTNKGGRFDDWKASDSSSTHGGGPGFDGNGDAMWGTAAFQAEAAAAANMVSLAQTGDPVDIPSGPRHRGGGRTAGGGSTHISNAPVINFSPNVVITASSGSGDLSRVSDELVAMMQDKLATLEMRSA